MATAIRVVGASGLKNLMAFDLGCHTRLANLLPCATSLRFAIRLQKGQKMRVKTVCSLAAIALALGVPACAAVADDTGLAILHDLRREGGRNCFLDHFHYGSSVGAPSRRAAEIEAVNSWSGFVDLEYGSDWARFSRAASKLVKCEQSSKVWGCEVEARPCK